MCTFRSESQARNPKKSITGSRFGFLIIILFLRYCTCYIEILNKEPKIVDLLKIFDGSEHHYKIIGDSLEVKVTDISYDAKAPEDSLRLVFDRWREKNKDVTWKRIKQVCEDFPDKFGRVKSDLEEYLSSKKACERYFDKKQTI